MVNIGCLEWRPGVHAELDCWCSIVSGIKENVKVQPV
jgi:hypothetical protein